MDRVSEINILESVIHVLDTGGDEPILNEYMLDLTDEKYSFLLKHITKCFKDEDLKYAAFNKESNIKCISEEYLTGHSSIIDTSKKLAAELFRIMKHNSFIPSCDLLIVSISTEIGPMLCILKMDYTKNYVHSINIHDEKLGIDIITSTIGLPGSSQKINKGVFIKVPRAGNKYDMFILDKGSKTKEHYGENYFRETYLDVSIIESDRDQTKKLYSASEQWTRINLCENAEEAERVRSALKQELKDNNEVKIESLSEKLFKTEEIQNDFKEFIQNKGIIDIVKIDKEYIDKKLQKTRLKIDNDIDLYINNDVYMDGNRFEIVRNGDGSINIVLKYIRNYIEK